MGGRWECHGEDWGPACLEGEPWGGVYGEGIEDEFAFVQGFQGSLWDL